MEKHIIVTDEDVKQAKILFNAFSEASFSVKGDAVQMLAKAQMWLANHIRTLSNAQPLPQPEVIEQPIKTSSKRRG